DFIALTDHNTLRALKDGYEGWYGNTLLLVGCEINDKENKNHYLAFDIEEAISTRTSAKTYVKKVMDAGGIGFLAHPHEKRNHMKEHPPYPWTEWDTKDFTGIEIWNHMSEWMENLTEQNKYQAFVHPLKTIMSPQPETLKVWDELNQTRPVPAIGGIDAHAHKYNILGFVEVEVFPYKVLFKSIRTHILLDTEIKKGKSIKDFLSAKKMIYSALKNGCSFVANDYHADSKGFRFYAQCKNKIHQMGENIPINSSNMLKVLLPGKTAEIKLYKNGTLIDSLVDSEAEFCVNLKGVYRVEIYLDKKAWIFSNHIRIGY
ncbi:MAG: histidinol-phosphatase, partial [Bacteroidota bacterium]|nr:histidinol-phosphatase [Bacteroidota bacterium]